MWEWLASPIDPTRVHEISASAAWHARTMTLAWGILAPVSVIIARFFKILPSQNWPNELDSVWWWRTHWIGQSLVVVLSVVGFVLVLPRDAELSWHTTLGYILLAGLLAQALLGFCRGNKGGPTAKGSPRGHHYDMTLWRRIFETIHKSLGYALLLLAAGTIVMGLWSANGPVWMWATLTLWWLFLIYLFIRLQRRGMAVDTYQAIWGDDPSHPGNRLPHPGWGVRRPGETRNGDSDVRNDRRNRV